MVKTAVIQFSKFNISQYSEIIQSDFKTTVVGDVEYKYITAFAHYIDNYPFDFVFDSHEGFHEWLKSGLDKEIVNVQYDWNNDKAYITIADTNFPGPHEFDCTETWTEQDCINAINTKFNRL